MIMLANVTDFDTNLVLDEAKGGEIFRLSSDGTFAPAFGNGATGTWEGLLWEEMEMWARLADACDNGEVVASISLYDRLGDNENSEATKVEEWLVGGSDENGDGSLLQIFCAHADVRDWKGGEGVEEGQYPLMSETGNEEYYNAFWQKNAETGNPYRLDDFKYNDSFFEIRR